MESTAQQEMAADALAEGFDRLGEKIDRATRVIRRLRLRGLAFHQLIGLRPDGPHVHICTIDPAVEPPSLPGFAIRPSQRQVQQQ